MSWWPSRGFSASKTQLLGKCGHWLKDGSRHWRGDNYRAMLGTRFHASLDSYIKGDIAKADELAPKELLEDVLVARSYVDQNHITRSEEAYAWHPDTGAKAIDTMDRNYPKIHGEIYGTADVILPVRDNIEGFRCMGSSVSVEDWKTGSLGGAKDQMLTLGAMVSLTTITDRVQLHVLSVGNGMLARIPVGHVDSREHAESHLKKVHLQVVQSERSAPNPGSHCYSMFCNHASFCEVSKPLVGELHMLDVVDVWGAQEALRMLPAAEAAVNRVREQLRKVASENGGYIEVDGRKWGKQANGKWGWA